MTFASVLQGEYIGEGGKRKLDKENNEARGAMLYYFHLCEEGPSLVKVCDFFRKRGIAIFKQAASKAIEATRIAGSSAGFKRESTGKR